MIKLNKLQKLGAIAALAFTTLTLGACSDDLGVNTPQGSDAEGIILRIPNIEGAAQFTTRATSEAAGREGGISDLYLIVFKKSGDSWAKTDCQNLKDKGPDLKSDSYAPYSDYTLSLDPGTYRFYILGNLLSYLPGNYDYNTSVNSIDDIKNLELSMPGLLSAGNLPMVSLSKVGTSENPSGIDCEIEITGSETSKVIYADLNFLCSKVRYTVLFDKSEAASAFGNNNVTFTDNVALANIVNTTPVGEALSSYDGKYIDAAQTSALTGKAYPSGTYPPTNGSSNDLSGSAADWTSSRRAWQGICYLPENTNKGKKTTLSISGECVDPSSQTLFEINKVIDLCPEGQADEMLSRGTMYDLVMTVKDYDVNEINITALPWVPAEILADLVHTYLTLERTNASVTSIEGDVIEFHTDGRGLSKECFSCQDNDGLEWSSSSGNTGLIAEPVIVLSEIDNENNTLVFKANPDIDVTKVKTDAQGHIKGVATCYITAGNIKKQLKISYDLSPYFTVTPVLQKIRYTAGSAELEKVFEFSTNLGGIVLKGRTGASNASTTYISGSTSSSSSSVGSSTITIKSDDALKSSGRIIVTATTNPGETVSHYFTATPLSQPSTPFSEDLEVMVMPPYGNYYIYFRAINDYQGNGDGSGYEFLNGNYASYWPAEGSKDWTDWWSANNNSSYSDNNHLIYVYGQNGETLNNYESRDSWRFNDFLDSNSATPSASQRMTHSGQYTGWYSYELSATNKADDGIHIPEPGKTLLIFYANRNSDGIEKHRAPHHLDAGITLFDYEDREGWILYDPTRSPYATSYDDRPIIEDVTYTIYSEGEIKGWWNMYGNSSSDKTTYEDHGEWTVYYNMRSGESVKQSNGLYKTSIKLKAPKGDYAKNIKLKHTVIKDMPITENYVVFGLYNNWFGSGSVSSSSVPYAYFLNDANNQVGDNWPGYKMTKISGSTGSGDYYVKIPAGATKVIFNNNAGNQYPTNGNGGITVAYKNGNPRIYYSDNITYEAYWTSGTPTEPVETNENVLMFNGQAMPGNSGYYRNGKWSAN